MLKQSLGRVSAAQYQPGPTRGQQRGTRSAQVLRSAGYVSSLEVITAWRRMWLVRSQGQVLQSDVRYRRGWPYKAARSTTRISSPRAATRASAGSGVFR